MCNNRHNRRRKNMKVRSAIVLAVAVASLVPTAASATHCDSPIYLFSQYRTEQGVPDPRGGEIHGPPTAVSSAIGCTVVRDTVLGAEDPTAHPATETDLIYPGTNVMTVRLLENGSDGSIVSSATLKFAGTTYNLNMQPTLDITGAPSTYLDSQVIPVDPNDTLAGNIGEVSICLTTGDCYERVYKTFA
jgi:hypothetical protein